MKSFNPYPPARSKTSAGGFTLIEVMVSTGLMTLVLAAVTSLFLYGAKNFIIEGNYTDLNRQSRHTVDVLSKEIRGATSLVSFTNGVSLLLQNTTAGTTTLVSYNTNSSTLTMTKTSGGTATTMTLLTQCDQWGFTLYSRAPYFTSTNITFYLATNGSGTLDPNFCKLISMSWKCSRPVMTTKLTTEHVETAEVVLRNQVKY